MPYGSLRELRRSSNTFKAYKKRSVGKRLISQSSKYLSGPRIAACIKVEEGCDEDLSGRANLGCEQTRRSVEPGDERKIIRVAKGQLSRTPNSSRKG